MESFMTLSEVSDIVMTVVVICLILWRVSYGTNNGLFAEAAGLIAVIASFAAVYYLTLIAGAVLNKNFGAQFLNIIKRLDIHFSNPLVFQYLKRI